MKGELAWLIVVLRVLAAAIAAALAGLQAAGHVPLPPAATAALLAAVLAPGSAPRL